MSDNLVSDPLVKDQETIRLTRLLRIITLPAMAFTIVAILPAVQFFPASVPGLIVAAFLVALHGGVLLLARRNRMRLASLLLSCALWGVVTLMTFTYGGIQVLGMSGYFIVILIANLLLGYRTGLFFFLLSGFAGLAALLFDINNRLPAPLLPMTPVFEWASQAAVFVTTVLLLQLAFRSLQEALQQTSQNERHLQRRAVQIQVAAEVARDATAVREMDNLLNRAVNLIRDRFGFYHAGIFLNDEQGEYAILTAATGEAGRQMIALEHKLKIGEVGIVGYVAGSGQPRIALDVGQDAVHFRNPWLPETRSEMALPLQVNGRVIGVLDVQSQAEAAFEADDVAILQTMADQLAVAFETARLFDATRRQLEELTVLHAVATAGAEATSVNMLIERTTQVIGEKLFPDNFGVILLDEASGLLHAHPSYRERPSLCQGSIRLGQGITGQVALDGRPRRSGDVTLDPTYLAVDPLTRSEVCVPLKAGERVIGVINAESTRLNAFVEADERLLATLAGQMATAIEKLRLFEAEHRRREEAETLRDATSALTSTLDLNQVLDRILTNLRGVVPYDSSCVFLVQNNCLKAVAGRNLPEPNELECDFPLDDDLFQAVLQAGRAVIIPEVQEDPRFEGWCGTHDVRSWVGIPLIVRGKVIGYLTLDNNTPNAYGETEAELAQAFANQAASAIHNAQLFNAEQQRSAELEALRQASLRLTSSLEWQPVLEAIIEQASKLIAANDAQIFLFDSERLTFGAALKSSALPNSDSPPAGNREPQPSSLAYSVARSGQRIVIPDMATHPLFQGKAQQAALQDGDQHGALLPGAMIALPLRVGSQVLGVMNMTFAAPHRFNPNELRVLELLADQAAVALENARLYAEAQRRAKELAAALAQLRELDRLKSEFIQNVSHELRTPLAIVRGYAELLDGGDLGDLLPEQRGPVSIITRRVRMLSKLVDDLLAILESESYNLDREPVDLSYLVYTLLADFQNAVERTGLTMTAEVAPNLPPVPGNSNHLRRVLDNLVGNAIKFTPAGGCVTLRLYQEKDALVLEVADTGIGIPADQLERVFDRFYQVNGSSTRRYGGTGLGLALVKEIVEAHDGCVTVESRLYEGSTFRVRLPVCPPKEGGAASA